MQMDTAKMIGKTLTLPGYGTAEKKKATGKVIAIDNRHATLEFTHPGDKTKTTKMKFRLTDGMGVGSQPETGIRISPEDLAALNGKAPSASRASRNGKTASSKPADAGSKTESTADKSENAPRARRAKDDVKIAATDWFPMERIRIGGRPPMPGDGQCRLRISSRGFGATLKMPAFSHTKGETAEKKHFVDQWRAFVDKRWIFVYLDVAAAQYFWGQVASLLSQEGAPQRSLKTIVRDLKAAFPKTLKGDPLADAAVRKVAADDRVDKSDGMKKPLKTKPAPKPAPAASETEEVEETEEEEDEAVDAADADEIEEDEEVDEEELEEVEEAE
jgi:hypothetical protein